MQGNLARPVWGWGPGEIPGPTPLFCGNDNGGRTAAILFSLIGSAKRYHLDPFAWLRDVLTRLPVLCAKNASIPETLLQPLLPDAWAPTV